CVCGKKIGPDPRNFNQRVSLGRNDLLIRTFPKYLSISFSSIFDDKLLNIIFISLSGVSILAFDALAVKRDIVFLNSF
ncbi:hypothetical protein ACXNAM_23215, partial [Kluyvera cryocrescens]